MISSRDLPNSYQQKACFDKETKVKFLFGYAQKGDESYQLNFIKEKKRSFIEIVNCNIFFIRVL
jgi:DNA primase